MRCALLIPLRVTLLAVGGGGFVALQSYPVVVWQSESQYRSPLNCLQIAKRDHPFRDQVIEYTSRDK